MNKLAGKFFKMLFAALLGTAALITAVIISPVWILFKANQLLDSEKRAELFKKLSFRGLQKLPSQRISEI